MVRETLGNGFVVGIELLEINGNLISVWEGIDPSEIGTPVEFSVDFPQTSQLVIGAKIIIDTNRHPVIWEEIDAISISGSIVQDCNSNSIIDSCEIAAGDVDDCNSNGVPDECENLPDCDGDGLSDACELGSTEADCNGNSIPDSCDLAAGSATDCNANGILDECDMNTGSGQDCDRNGILDECDIASGNFEDCNDNGVIDGCELTRVELRGNWDGFSGQYADVWGYEDHAYIGRFYDSAVDIISVVDPSDPQHVAEYALPAPNQNADARDIKVADGMLFIGLEADGNGSVHVVDVRDPANPVAAFDIVLASYLTVHNLFYHQGFLYIVDLSAGTGVAIVDLRAIDLDNPPSSPITDTLWTITDGGVHDVVAQGDRLYVCKLGSGLWIYDIADLANTPPQALGSGPGISTHSCWPTADGNFVITGEERLGGGIKVYQVTDNPDGTVSLEIVDEVNFSQSSAFSVHNQGVIGNRVYNAWFQSGLQVFDVDPDTGWLEWVAGYDTFEQPTLPTYDGAWGIYPFLGDDRILISDISNGLFVLELTDLDGDDDGVIDGCEPELFIRGEVNGDGSLDIADVIYSLNYLFGEIALSCQDAADTNDDGLLNIADPINLLGFLFSGDTAPPAPFPDCGADPTADALTCENFGVCP